MLIDDGIEDYLRSLSNLSDEQAMEETTHSESTSTIQNSRISNDSIAEESGRFFHPEKRKRKHQTDINAWKKNIIKTKRNKGEEYINYKGHLVNKREIKPACKQNCKFKCSSIINHQEREKILGIE